MNNTEFNNLEAGTKVTMRAFDHDANEAVITTATYNGWCDHPDWGTAVNVTYDNDACHMDDLFTPGVKETDTDIPVAQFLSNVEFAARLLI